jgi:hypothetical protein
MPKKLTGLWRRMSMRASEDLAHPHVAPRDLADDYREMAADAAREDEAHAWAEAILGDVAEEARRGLVG